MDEVRVPPVLVLVSMLNKRTQPIALKVDRILLRFDHMTRRDLLVEMIKKSICVFRNNINKNSATKEM